MTDELTDAVRRLKELQADVERLKAGDDRQGVPRLFFTESETAVGRDNQAGLRLQQTVEVGKYGGSLSQFIADSSQSIQQGETLGVIDTKAITIIGVQFDSTFTVELELVVGIGEAEFVIDTFKTDRLDVTRRVPEATRVELRSQSTVPDNASLLFGQAGSVKTGSGFNTSTFAGGEID